MTKIFSIINNKGGTGKTTTALNLGAALAKQGKEVLLVDFDSQCNLSTALGINNAEKHIGSALLNQAEIQDCVLKASGMALIPASGKLADYEFLVNNEPGREYLLKENLGKIAENYDYVLIDCAPSLGTFAINSLVAANYYIVPMQTENFAYIGLNKITFVAEKVRNRMNASLELGGILFVKYSPRIKFGQAIISNIQADPAMKDKLFETYIRQDIALMESAAFCQTVFDYEPNSRGATDYLNLSKELMERYG